MTKKKDITPWTNLPEDFDPLEYEGFVYLIVNTLTNQKYIGRKYLRKKTSKKVKGKKRRKIEWSESDWRTYKSSSKELQQLIKTIGKENFQFVVLSLHKTRAEVNYAEVKEQFSRDVLYAKLDNGLYEYLNYCILNRYWRKTT